MDIRIRTNLYLITAILLTSNFLTLCEGDNDIDHEIFSDHLYDLDHLDDLHDINNFDDDKVIHRVELVQHNGDAMNNFASTSHTNKDTNNKLFTNTIPINQKSDVPTAFTKVVKQTVIKQSNNDGNNSPETNDLSMEDILYSNNKLKENGIGNMNNIILPPIPSQPASDLQGNIKNIIHTTVTKTTTSGSPSSKLNESFNRINNLDALSTMSSANSNYNAGIAGSTSSQSNSLDENSNRKTISTIENIIDKNDFDNSKRIFHTPGGSFRRMKTTIIKQHNINDSNDRGDLDKSTVGFNRDNTSLNNIVPTMTNPLGYNTVTTATVDRDNNIFNKGISSRRQQTNLNKFNALGNLVSETGAHQNPSSIVRTKTTIIKNGRAADDFKLGDLNDKKIDYNVAGDGMSTSNNIVSSMTNPLGYNTVTTAAVDRDNNIFNKGISSRRQQTNLNKFNALGNLVSETSSGAHQNPSSIVRTKTTIIKNGRAADDFKLGDLNDKKIDYNVAGDGMSTSNNIASSMTNPLGYNTVTTATVDRDSEFNKGIPSRTQQTNLNKLNSLGNLGSETGALQNPNSIVQTKTTIIKNGRAADDFKLSDSNDKKIDYNVAADGMSTSNNIGNLNYDIKSSNNYDNDNGSGYSYSYSFGNGMNVGDYDNIGDIISSSHLMDGSSSGGYSTYMLLHSGYSKGNGKPKKIKKNGSTEQFKGRRSKNISYGKNKGNRQIRVKNGRNYKNTRSSKNRSGGDSQFNSSNSFTRGGKNRSSSSSSSFSDDSSMKNKESCHCNKGRKLNKRDSSESHESSHSKEHRGPEINYLGSSMDNHLMQNNGDFVARFPPPLPPSMEREPQSNLLFNRIQGQRPDQSLNLSQTTVLDRLEKTRSQLINDQQLPNIDVSNQYLTHQIPNTGSLFKSDSQQRQYLGPPDLGLGLGTEQGPGIHPGHDFGPQANPFDSKPYFVGDYPKYFENNLQSPSPPPPSPPPSQPTHPYSFNLDFYSDLSKMGSTIPELTDVQSGQGNQINIYNDLPQMQQDIEGSGLNRMEATNSRSMTTRTRSPIIQYFKTIKTTENIDGNDASDIRSVQTQSVPPKVYGTM